MGKIPVVLLVASQLSLGGCGGLNKSAILLNLKENESRIEATNNGFLAIKASVVTKNNHLIALLLKNEKDDNYVVPLNPAIADSVGLYFGPFAIAEKIDKERRDYNFLLFQLPKGVYRTKYILVGYGGQDSPRPHKLQEETVKIEANKTKYVGSFRIVSDMTWIVTNVFEVEKIDEDPKDIPTRQTIPRAGEVDVVVESLLLEPAP